MSLIENLLLGQFLSFTLVLTRVGGLMMTAPVFGSRAVPVRIRALLAVALALLMTPLQAPLVVSFPRTMPDLLILIAGELAIGLILGLGIMILFSGIQVAGQIVSQLSGTALADVFQPGFDASVPLISQLLLQVTLAVFMLAGGHRLVMAGLLDTFSTVPIGTAAVSDSVVTTLTSVLSTSFVLGIRVAAPVMTALLLATLVLGFVSRTVPQINILAVGFGINSLVALGGFFLTMGSVVWIFQDDVASVIERLEGAFVRVRG